MVAVCLYGGCVFVAYICWLIWEYTHSTLAVLFYFVQTNVSNLVLLLTQTVMGCLSGQLKFLNSSCNDLLFTRLVNFLFLFVSCRCKL